MTIRSATPADIPAMLEMLRLSATEQGSPDALIVTTENLLEDGFGPRPRFFCLIAAVGEIPAGLALCYFNYCTWISRKGLYLEDLFVLPEFRKRGIARALMDHLTVIGQNEGCGRMLWMVHTANERALRFYESIGAAARPEWTLMVKSIP